MRAAASGDARRHAPPGRTERFADKLATDRQLPGVRRERWPSAASSTNSRPSDRSARAATSQRSAAYHKEMLRAKRKPTAGWRHRGSSDVGRERCQVTDVGLHSPTPSGWCKGEDEPAHRRRQPRRRRRAAHKVRWAAALWRCCCEGLSMLRSWRGCAAARQKRTTRWMSSASRRALQSLRAAAACRCSPGWARCDDRRATGRSAHAAGTQRMRRRVQRIAGQPGLQPADHVHGPKADRDRAAPGRSGGETRPRGASSVAWCLEVAGSRAPTTRLSPAVSSTGCVEEFSRRPHTP